jgi:hypothetical protein
MSFDIALAWVFFALSAMVAFLEGAKAFMRFVIDRAFASSQHTFYVVATGHQPRCADCPMNKRCPYSNGVVCHFSKASLKIKT